MHRDVKPLNLILDENYNIKLIDFGEAKYFDGSHEQDEFSALLDTFVGTPYY